MVTIREAGPGDVDAVMRLVRDSADSQGALDQLCIDAPALRAEMFGDRPRVHALVALDGDRPVGVAVYFFTFSTWVSVHGIHLEDLYVDPAWRRQGIGAVLIRALVDVAVAHECRRMQWFVHRHNDGARRFYESVGALAASDWIVMHLDRA